MDWKNYNKYKKGNWRTRQISFYYLFIKNEVKQINSYPIIYQEQVANLQSNHRRFQVRWIGEFDLV